MAAKTTTVVEDGVAYIEVQDADGVAEVAKKLLDAADDPAEVDTTSRFGGIGFKVSEKLAKKAKFAQTATKTAAERKAEKEAADKAAAEKKAADEKAAAEAKAAADAEAAAQGGSGSDSGDSGDAAGDSEQS